MRDLVFTVIGVVLAILAIIGMYYLVRLFTRQVYDFPVNDDYIKRAGKVYYEGPLEGPEYDAFMPFTYYFTYHDGDDGLTRNFIIGLEKLQSQYLDGVDYKYFVLMLVCANCDDREECRANHAAIVVETREMYEEGVERAVDCGYVYNHAHAESDDHNNIQVNILRAINSFLEFQRGVQGNMQRP